MLPTAFGVVFGCGVIIEAIFSAADERGWAVAVFGWV
jgi:hypothetical protein